jgi:hypothetical protein
MFWLFTAAETRLSRSPGLACLDCSTPLPSQARSTFPHCSHLNPPTMAQEPSAAVVSETLPDAPAAPPAKQSVRSFKYDALLAHGQAPANCVSERSTRR